MKSPVATLTGSDSHIALLLEDLLGLIFVLFSPWGLVNSGVSLGGGVSFLINLGNALIP